MNANLLKKFKKEKTGSVTIEFAFMLLFLGIMLVFMVDLVLVRSTMGKLDSVSYSLVNILRERNAFYKDNPDKVTEQDVKKLRDVAQTLLYGKGSSQKVDIAIEQLTYTGDQAVVTNDGDGKECSAARPLGKHPELSPYSQSVNLAKQRQVPVYQVTLCVEITSPFKYFLLNKENRATHGIRSSSVSVSR